MLYYEDVDEEDLVDGLYKGLFSGTGDIYSGYFTPEEYESFMISTTASLCGICPFLPVPFLPYHYTFKCLRVVTKLPKKPMPTPSASATGVSTLNTSFAGKKLKRLLKKLNCIA